MRWGGEGHRSFVGLPINGTGAHVFWVWGSALAPTGEACSSDACKSLTSYDAHRCIGVERPGPHGERRGRPGPGDRE